MGRHRRRRGAFTEIVLDRRAWGDTPLFLLDVGCSGGIESRWQMFGDRLRAVGFDPLIAEVDRLNSVNAHPHTVYEAAFVTAPDYDARFPPSLRDDRMATRNNDPFQRTSTVAAMQRMPTSYVQSVFNAGAPIAFTDRRIALDEYVPTDAERSHVDFIKIDTDGHDIEVLLGTEGIMRAGGVLGLSIEAQFHGPVHEFANTFSNIDRLLRSRGFTLFDLQSHRYSRAALPAPFTIDLTAQTTSGQMLWGEALYFRDLASRDYERMWPLDVTAERVMKLACLYDNFNLPDCAAELIVNRAGFLEATLRDRLLDSLVSGEPGAYAAHMALFENDYTSFYPSRREPQASGEADAPGQSFDSMEVEKLRERIARLSRRNTQLEERLKDREQRVEFLSTRVTDLKRKRSSRVKPASG
jgi:hypothetical protein